MNPPPKEIDGARLVCFAETTGAVKPTAATTHRKNDQILDRREVWRSVSTQARTLFTCFIAMRTGRPTQTHIHLSVEDAKHQAELEYEGISGYWKEAG